jgi:hypothetical protein
LLAAHALKWYKMMGAGELLLDLIDRDLSDDSVVIVENHSRGLSAAGRRLWDAVSSDYALVSHELVLLESAARIADLMGDLQSLIDDEGLVLGGKTHPAVAQIRQQRLVLARLLVALRVPIGDEDARPSGQRRGIRGVYRLDAHAS